MEEDAYHFSDIWTGLVAEELGILLQKQEQIIMGKHISFSYPEMERSQCGKLSPLEIFKKYLDGQL